MRPIQIRELLDLYLKHRRISTDSREIKDGDIFFALKGEHFNGNHFALEAIHRGASAAIVDEPLKADHPNIYTVEDVLASLQEIARLYRQRLDIPVVAITGTNGKTTTKELVASVLSSRYRTFATRGNLNNHIGLPVSILSIPEDSEMAVIEMGANHIGEIAFLCKIALPGYGLITNIGKAHLEGFGSLDGIVRAKTELYHYIQGHEGLVFVNITDKLLAKHAANMRKVTYGPLKQADCHAKLKSTYPFLQLEWFRGDVAYDINSNLYGAYNYQNIAAAIAIGDYFAVVPESIIASIGAYIPENNRSQLIKTATNTLYLDAYNANPSSMELAIRYFHAVPEKNKMLILGDMMELGETSAAEHQKILETINSLAFQRVILIGNYFKELLPGKDLVFSNVRDAMSWLSQNPVRDSTILIKGSRKIELERLKDVL